MYTKPAPEGWTRISSSTHYRDANHMVAWLCEAFGFGQRIVVHDDDGNVVHAELELDGGILMVSPADADDAEPSKWGTRAATPLGLEGCQYADAADLCGRCKSPL